MNLKMRLITASYRQSDVTVELYGRTADGKSVTALYFGFKPYFYYVNPDDECIKKLRRILSFWICRIKHCFLMAGTRM